MPYIGCIGYPGTCMGMGIGIIGIPGYPGTGPACGGGGG